jgi:cyclohexanone monooxygenase
MEYSYGFDPELQQEWEWTERYARQPEILRYANHVADRFDLRRDISFDTRVMEAEFDEATGTWTVTTDGGESVVAQFVVAATGCLSSTNTPDFAGIDDFAGRLLHTGRWPHEQIGFEGERVAVIGTGSSGIQSIPVIATQADHLTVFQRTPNYSVPAHNRPLDPDEVAEIKADYKQFRAANLEMVAAYGARLERNDVATRSVSDAERGEQLERRWAHGGLPFLGAFNDILLDPAANHDVAEFVRAKIRDVVTWSLTSRSPVCSARRR